MLRFLPTVLVFILSCGDINVPFPDPGFDPGNDTPDEVPDGFADGAGDEGKDESVGDIPPCMEDGDCSHLIIPTCMTALCNEVSQCVLSPMQADTPCQLDPPVTDSCRASVCDGEGQCKVQTLGDGTPCIPGGEPPGPCQKFYCHEGACAKLEGCDDGNPCTEDFCAQPEEECRHTPLNEGDCDDQNPCTLADVCFAGVCDGKANKCDDGNPCTKNLCSTGEGCLNPPDDGASCEEGNLCTHNDQCKNGVCKPGALKLCVDGNPCTDDSCQPGTGQCSFEPSSEPCSDGDPCTQDDQCKAGQCVPGGPTDCNDGEPCTVDYCDPTQGCSYDLQPGCLNCSKNIDCADGNPCTDDQCLLEGEIGKCAVVPLTGVPCTDQDPCMIGDTCLNGNCSPGEEPNCFDGNPCTDDECNPLNGTCDFVPNELACDDDDDCTVQDHCENGVCVGMSIICDDQNNCTEDYCEQGACEFLPLDIVCNDGNPCTDEDRCKDKICVGEDKDCSDGYGCTIDFCDKDAGCVHTPIDDCLSCQLPSDCDDQNPCTDDVCNQGHQCEWPPMEGQGCEDGNLCTGPDLCEGDACVSGSNLDCTDGKECTADSCDPGTGCTYVPIAGTCDDGDPDTGPGQCVEGDCLPGILLHCEGKPDGLPCSDQDDSTDPDYCIDGQCRGLTRVNFVEGGQPTFLTDVDAGSGKAYATGYLDGGVDGPTGFVAFVPFMGKPSLITSTKAEGKVYRAISHLVAVGDGGLVAYARSWKPSSWVKGGVLGEALKFADGLSPDSLSDAFGSLAIEYSVVETLESGMPPFPDDCDFQDQYLITGRYGGSQGDALAGHCVLSQTPSEFLGCDTIGYCTQSSLLNADSSNVWPAAVSGRGQSCGAYQGCFDEAEFVGDYTDPTGLSFMAAFQGQKTTGSQFGQYTLVSGVPSGYGPARDMTRITGTDGEGVYVLVGDGGLLAYGPGPGPFKAVDLSTAGVEHAFTGVAAGSQYLFIVGTRTMGGDQDLVLFLHRIGQPLDDPGSYSEMIVEPCPLDFCEPFELTGMTVLADTVYLVGHLPDPASDASGGVSSGVVYFLTM